MKYKPGTSFEEWAEQVRSTELAEARRRIAKGDDVDVVLETMANRIRQKMMHPLLLALKPK